VCAAPNSMPASALSPAPDPCRGEVDLSDLVDIPAGFPERGARRRGVVRQGDAVFRYRDCLGVYRLP
jgi:hypothetical protein